MGDNKQGQTHADPEANDFDTAFKKYNGKKIEIEIETKHE